MITVDRNQNIIINNVKTNLVAIGYHGLEDKVTVAEGFSNQINKKGKCVHQTTATNVLFTGTKDQAISFLNNI